MENGELRIDNVKRLVAEVAAELFGATVFVIIVVAFVVLKCAFDPCTYPDPVCETCGEVLDGSHGAAECRPEQ